MPGAIIGKAAVKIVPDTRGFRRQADKDIREQLAGAGGSAGGGRDGSGRRGFTLPVRMDPRAWRDSIDKITGPSLKALTSRFENLKIKGPKFELAKLPEADISRSIKNLDIPNVEIPLKINAANQESALKGVNEALRNARLEYGRVRPKLDGVGKSFNVTTKEINSATKSLRSARRSIRQYGAEFKNVNQTVKTFSATTSDFGRISKHVNTGGKSMSFFAGSMKKAAGSSNKLRFAFKGFGGTLSKLAEYANSSNVAVSTFGKVALGSTKRFTKASRVLGPFLSATAKLGGVWGKVAVGAIVASGAVAKWGRSIKGAYEQMSGVSALRGLSRAFKTVLQNLQKLPLKLGPTIVMAGLLKIAVVSLVGSLVSLGHALAMIGVGAAAAAPGVFASLAIGAKIWGRAMADAGTVLSDVNNDFKELGRGVSKNFWAEAADPIRQVAKEYMPEIKKNTLAVSTEFGVFAGLLTKSFGNAFKGRIGGLFTPLIDSVKVVRPYLDDITQGIADLVLTGSSNLPKLTKKIGETGAEFGRFLTKAAEDGSLQRWIDTAAKNFSNLLSVLKSVSMIFADIAEAADKASGGTLENMANKLAKIRRITDSDAFKNGMTRTFLAADKAISKIAKISGPELTKFFQNFPTMMEEISPRIASIVGKIIKTIMKIINDPDVAKGFISMLEDFDTAIDNLQPGIEAMTPVVGTLFAAIGRVAKQLSPIISKGLKLFAKLAALLTPFLETLSEKLAKITDEILKVVDEDFGGELEDWEEKGRKLKETLEPLISVIEMMGESTKKFVEGVGKGLDWSESFTGPSFQLVLDAAKELDEALGNLSESLGLTGDGFSLAESFGIGFGQVLGFVAAIASGVLAFALGFLTEVINIFGITTGLVTGNFRGAWENAKQVFVRFADRVTRGITTLKGWFDKLKGWLKGLGVSFGDLDSEGSASVASLGSNIRSETGGWGGLLTRAGRSVVNGFISGVRSKFGAVRATFGALTRMIPRVKGPLPRDKKLLVPAGLAIMGGLIKSINSQRGALKSTLVKVTDDIEAVPQTTMRMIEAIGGRSLGKISSAVDVTEGLEVKQFVVQYNGVGEVPDPEGGFKTLGRKVATFF